MSRNTEDVRYFSSVVKLAWLELTTRLGVFIHLVFHRPIDYLISFCVASRQKPHHRRQASLKSAELNSAEIMVPQYSTYETKHPYLWLFTTGISLVFGFATALMLAGNTLILLGTGMVGSLLASFIFLQAFRINILFALRDVPNTLMDVFYLGQQFFVYHQGDVYIVADEYLKVCRKLDMLRTAVCDDDDHRRELEYFERKQLLLREKLRKRHVAVDKAFAGTADERNCHLDLEECNERVEIARFIARKTEEARAMGGEQRSEVLDRYCRERCSDIRKKYALRRDDLHCSLAECHQISRIKMAAILIALCVFSLCAGVLYSALGYNSTLHIYQSMPWLKIILSAAMAHSVAVIFMGVMATTIICLVFRNVAKVIKNLDSLDLDIWRLNFKLFKDKYLSFQQLSKPRIWAAIGRNLLFLVVHLVAFVGLWALFTEAENNFLKVLTGVFSVPVGLSLVIGTVGFIISMVIESYFIYTSTKITLKEIWRAIFAPSPEGDLQDAPSYSLGGKLALALCIVVISPIILVLEIVNRLIAFISVPRNMNSVGAAILGINGASSKLHNTTSSLSVAFIITSALGGWWNAFAVMAGLDKPIRSERLPGEVCDQKSCAEVHRILQETKQEVPAAAAHEPSRVNHPSYIVAAAGVQMLFDTGGELIPSPVPDKHDDGPSLTFKLVQ